MSRAATNKLVLSVLISLTAASLSSLLWWGNYLEDWENKAWDLCSRIFAAPSANTDKIVLVLLDQQSLDWANDNLGISWPWPRELHGAVINNCRRRGAVAMGIDVLFTEPSMYGVSDDAILAKAIGDTAQLALGSTSAGLESGKHLHWPANLPKPQYAFADPARPLALFPNYHRALLPLPEFGSAATILSNVNQRTDHDGIYRKFHPFVFFDGVPLPTLGIATLLATAPTSRLVLEDNTLHIGPYSLPLDRKGRMLLRFRGPAFSTYQALSAAPLIHQEMLLRQGNMTNRQATYDLQGKYVFYGFSAPGLLDLRPTPIGGKTAGVELHATTLDNILTGDFIRPINLVVQVIGFGLTILAATTMMTWFTRPLAQVLLIPLFVLLPVGAFTTAYQLGFKLQVVPLETAMMLTAILSVVASYLMEGRQRRFIQHSFRHYLSPEVIQELIDDPEKLQLGGERKEISILFSDIQGFTTISEHLDPEALTSLLNDYLSAMTDIILDERGTIDKYEGDAIIAFWNAPLPVEDHAVRAVRTALRCQEELARLRPTLKQRYGHELHMRIGINTGTAVVGNLGSSQRFDYTMLGDAVNLAARLEGVNKQFGSWTLISEATQQLVHHIHPCREMAKVTVVGRHMPVTIFEPYRQTTYLEKEEIFKTFAQGLAAFYAGDIAHALEIFEQIAQQDPPADHYHQRCRQLLTEPKGLSAGNGLWELTTK